LLITGDLTEEGSDDQFEALARILLEGPWAPERVTLLPGNHDGYCSLDGFERALQGPLRPFARTSRNVEPLFMDGLALIPISTLRAQHYIRSGGELRASDLARIKALSASSELRSRAVVLGMHHPPLTVGLPGGHWLDGLAGHWGVLKMLRELEHCHAICGHVHRSFSRRVRLQGPAQLFAAPAVVDNPQPLRLYRVEAGKVTALAPSPAGSLIPAPVPEFVPV
jgi:Icc protein